MRRNRRRQSAKNKNRPSRLVGWLISYALDDNGQYHELRAGRYLISSRDIGETATIKVSEHSIASPHLAVSAAHNHTLLVQDIFTESGTYLKRAGTEEEERISGPTSIEHGDWIRIGKSTRFQVCLIDGSSRE